MQTFLPYQDYAQCARVLDDARLQKQRIEAVQILAALLERKWVHEEDNYEWLPMDLNPMATHPSVRMWSGHEGSLLHYIKEMCMEWMTRQRQPGFGILMNRVWNRLRPLIQEDSYEKPRWLTEELCSNHRSILLGKDPIKYGVHDWQEVPATVDPVTKRWPYIWPV